MPITLYGLKNCDTCKKALRTLKMAGADVVFVDIRTDADLETKLPAWLATIEASVLVNRRSTTWRTLADLDKALIDGDVTKLLIAHPTLIKRPVIETEDEGVYVGWTQQTANALTTS